MAIVQKVVELSTASVASIAPSLTGVTAGNTLALVRRGELIHGYGRASDGFGGADVVEGGLPEQRRLPASRCTTCCRPTPERTIGHLSLRRWQYVNYVVAGARSRTCSAVDLVSTRRKRERTHRRRSRRRMRSRRRTRSDALFVLFVGGRAATGLRERFDHRSAERLHVGLFAQQNERQRSGLRVRLQGGHVHRIAVCRLGRSMRTPLARSMRPVQSHSSCPQPVARRCLALAAPPRAAPGR
jgi:hypothetical protein